MQLKFKGYGTLKGKVFAPKYWGDPLSLEKGISENSVQIVGSTAGLKGFYWSAIDIPNKKITLATVNGTHGTDLIFDIADYWQVGDIITIHNNEKWLHCSKITAMSERTITVDSFPFTSTKPKNEHITDNAVYAVTATVRDEWASFEARDGLCDFGQYSMSIGEYCQALNYASVAMGRDNIGLGQYSATFGRRNKAGYCSVATGNKNTIFSDQTFSAGNNNTSEAWANSSLMFGSGNTNHWADKTNRDLAGKRSIVGGENNHNYNVDSAIFGTGNTNKGDDSLVSGNGNTNNGARSIVCGISNTNNGSDNITFGNSSTNDGACSILMGTANSYNNKNTSIVVGEGVRNEGWHSAVFGGNNTNASSFSLVVGTKNNNPSTTGGRVLIAGEGHTATRNYQTLLGSYSNPSANTLLAIGNGSASVKSNAFEVLSNGTAKLGAKSVATEEYVSNATKNLATTTYVDNAVKNASANIGNIIGDTVTCGTNNTNEGSHGAVFGDGNTNGSGTESALVGGHLNTNSKGSREHSGKYNAIFGHDNNSTATDTLIVGNNNGVNDPINCQNGIIGGRNNYAGDHENVLVSGHNNRTSRDNQVLFGEYSNPSANTLLAIGNGTEGARSNAFEVLDDGIKIGNTTITEAQLIKLLALLS